LIRRRPGVVSIFVVYAVAVVAVTIFPIRVHRRTRTPWWVVVELVPFHVPAGSFVLNVLMFMPFGVLVPLLWPRVGSVRRVAGLALAASAAIEVTQLVLWLAVGNFRTVDVNDLIANTAGGVLGLAVLRVRATGSRPGRSPRAWWRWWSRRPVGSSSTRRGSR
jgi:glycopeptide antibiotics resistance protein